MDVPEARDKDALVLRVLRRIGSPAGVQPDLDRCDPAEIRAEYALAYENRIGLLYVLALPETPDLHEFAPHRASLLDREAKTRQVVARLCAALNEADFRYVIYKTVRPFPFTPNDTDVLFLETRARYREAVRYLFEQGYRPHGEAPLQTLVYDPAGVGKVGKHKEGGIYYIDLYRAAGADYFVYLDSRRAAMHVRSLELEGVTVPALRPELELAVLLFHNVFPENTYHLEHFYLPLYYLCGPNAVDADLFIRFVRENHFAAPVRANLSITARLHELAFGYVPEELARVLGNLGRDASVICRFEEQGLAVPCHFTGGLFVRAALSKVAERASLLSLIEQGVHMLSPRFFGSVVTAVRTRLFGSGAYEQA